MNTTKKKIFVILTIIVMLIVSRFVVRIIDATVQIDDDVLLLSILLIAVNSIIGFISYKIYRLTNRK